MATKKIIDLEGLKVYDKEYVQPIEKHNETQDLKIKSLEYLLKGEVYNDSVLSGSAKVVDIPSNTAPNSMLMELGGNIEKDDTLTARAGVVGETIVHEGSLSSPKFTEMQLCGENIAGLINQSQAIVKGVSTKVESGEVIFNGTSDGSSGTLLYANFKNGNLTLGKGTYTLNLNGSFENRSMFVWLSEVGDPTSRNGLIVEGQSKTFTLEKTMTFSGIIFYLTATIATFTNKSIKPMLTVGSIAKSFKQYIGQTLTLTEQTLNGQDEVYFQIEGNKIVGYKLTKYGSVELETFTFNTYTANTFTSADFATFLNQNGITTSNWRNKTIFAINVNDLSVSTNLAYLNTGGVQPTGTLVYELATPTLTKIGEWDISEGFDFRQVENVITNNTQFATETQNIQKGVVVASMTEKVETYDSENNLINTYLLSQLAQIKERVGDITLGYIDFDRKVFVKNKRRRNASELYFGYQGQLQLGRFDSNTTSDKKPGIDNVWLDIFETTTLTSGMPNMSIRGVNANSNIVIIFEECAGFSDTLMRNILDNLYITYEIEPQEIDISDILDDEDKFVEIEENGTIEFTEKTAYKVLTQVKVA